MRGFALLAASMVVVGGACSREAERSSGPAVVARLDAHRSLGEPVVAGNLTVWPVYTDAPLDIGEFLTLGEAQGKGLAAVREVGAPAAAQTAAPGAAANDSAPAAPAQEVQQVEVQRGEGGGAVVNTLVLENKGELPILVLAGTVVKGGQQDRQIGQDFVIAAHSTIDVDAFCVEPGRWTGVADFDASQIAVKSVRASGQYEKDQGKVWENVRDTLSKAGVSADSETLVAAQERVDAEVVKRREDLAKTVADRFDAWATQETPPVGFAYAVNGKPVTVRAFAHERIFRAQFDAFVKAMSMEAELARADDAGAKVPAKAEDVVALVKGLEEAKEEQTRTRAVNYNGYRVSKDGFNGNCYIPSPAAPGTDVVVTQDWTAK